MLDCLIIGDSLAVGVGQTRPSCVTLAKTGITSAAYVKTFLPSVPRKAARIVISLGVNDDASVPTRDYLLAVRRELQGQQVVWLLPGLKQNVRDTIKQIARDMHDEWVDTLPYVGPDHLHPSGTGYQAIASSTLELVGRQPAPAGAQRFALLDPPPASRLKIGGLDPNLSGNLRPYRDMPIVVYPNTYNGRVIYGLPGTMFSASRPQPYPFGCIHAALGQCATHYKPEHSRLSY